MNNGSNEYRMACGALLKMEKDAGYSNLVLSGLLREEPDSRKRAFCTAAVYGVLSRAVTLDAALSQYVRGSLRKLDPEVLCILRLGAWLLYFTKHPEYAVVDECVRLCPAFRKTSAKSLVNGVLRSMVRDHRKLPPGDPWVMGYSAPQALAEAFVEDYGEQAAKTILAESLVPPPLFLRVNTLRIRPEALAERFQDKGVSCRVPDGFPEALRLERAGAADQLPAFREGLFHVQDLSSQRCAAAVFAAPGMDVLDVCAAPGGKTFTIAEIMQDRGTVTACDSREKRVGLIRQGAKRLGIGCVAASVRDAADPGADPGRFDRILCDVPCSGYGVLRRKPEIRRKDPDSFLELPGLQYKILENSAQYIRQGGLLIYSTCTLRRAENDAVTARFLSGHPEFREDPSAVLGGDWKQTFFPDRDGGDGFFVAVMRRAG